MSTAQELHLQEALERAYEAHDRLENELGQANARWRACDDELYRLRTELATEKARAAELQRQVDRLAAHAGKMTDLALSGTQGHAEKVLGTIEAWLRAAPWAAGIGRELALRKSQSAFRCMASDMIDTSFAVYSSGVSLLDALAQLAQRIESEKG